MILGTGRHGFGADHVFERRRDLGFYTIELTFDGTMLRRTEAASHFREQANETLYLVPPHTPYALRGRAAGEEIWVIFEPRDALRDCLAWPVGEFGLPELAVPRTPLGRQVLQALQDAHAFMALPGRRRALLVDNALERLLLLAADVCEAGDAPVDPRVRKAIDLIHRRLSAPLTVAELARGVNLSPSRFAHLFRRETGLGPVGYLERVRMEKAQALLLRTDLQIKAVAARVGYDDAYYFSTRFRKLTGQSPTAWRRCPGPAQARGTGRRQGIGV